MTDAAPGSLHSAAIQHLVCPHSVLSQHISISLITLLSAVPAEHILELTQRSFLLSETCRHSAYAFACAILSKYPDNVTPSSAVPPEHILELTQRCPRLEVFEFSGPICHIMGSASLASLHHLRRLRLHSPWGEQTVGMAASSPRCSCHNPEYSCLRLAASVNTVHNSEPAPAPQPPRKSGMTDATTDASLTRPHDPRRSSCIA